MDVKLGYDDRNVNSGVSGSEGGLTLGFMGKFLEQEPV